MSEETNLDFASRVLKKVKTVSTMEGLGRLTSDNIFNEEVDKNGPLKSGKLARFGLFDKEKKEVEPPKVISPGVERVKIQFQKQFTSQIVLKMKLNASAARNLITDQKLSAAQGMIQTNNCVSISSILPSKKIKQTEENTTLKQQLTYTKRQLEDEREKTTDLTNICMSTSVDPTQAQLGKRGSWAEGRPMPRKDSKKTITDRVQKEKAAMMLSNKLNKCKNGIRDLVIAIRSFLEEFKNMATDIQIEVSEFGACLKPLFEQEIRTVELAYATPMKPASPKQQSPLQKIKCISTQTKQTTCRSFHTQTDVNKTNVIKKNVPTPIQDPIVRDNPTSQPESVPEEVITKDIIPNLITDLSAIKDDQPLPTSNDPVPSV